MPQNVNQIKNKIRILCMFLLVFFGYTIISSIYSIIKGAMQDNDIRYDFFSSLVSLSMSFFLEIIFSIICILTLLVLRKDFAEKLALPIKLLPPIAALYILGKSLSFLSFFSILVTYQPFYTLLLLASFVAAGILITLPSKLHAAVWSAERSQDGFSYSHFYSDTGYALNPTTQKIRLYTKNTMHEYSSSDIRNLEWKLLNDPGWRPASLPHISGPGAILILPFIILLIVAHLIAMFFGVFLGRRKSNKTTGLYFEVADINNPHQYVAVQRKENELRRHFEIISQFMEGRLK